ncbi:MAG: cytochrome c oxidase subunit II [Chloroflexi bacterium]|nr:cytochrome c oxidase subunit II [Chloroflexota bacterium]
MPFPRASGVGRKLTLLGLGAMLMALLSGCMQQPYTTVMPKTEAARMIQDLYVLVFWLAVFVFVGVQAGLVYVLWRFRARPGHEMPEQTHGNTTLEIGWTIAPAVILVIMAVPTIRTIFALESAPPRSPDGNPPLVIEITGRQWWWEFKYPEHMLADGKTPLTTANEMVIPTGRTVYLSITSDNVIHSFWIHQLMGKIDAVPNHDNHIWFTAEEPGQYWGQCAEYCGIQHAQMRMNVIAMSPADYQAWVARNSKPAVPETDLAMEGEKAFGANGCAGCHTVDGNATAVGKTGPNLSHFGSRTTMGASIMPNTAENLAAWIEDPQKIKPGNMMQNLHVRPSDVEALVAYLHSLK